ncbi:MAG: glycosyltransferase family 4 protein [Candidatus Dormibacteraeota bacterium]|nr:glycosyltransferase family 4 protein [Candidatus Dormibacteraeota bacterium]
MSMRWRSTYRLPEHPLMLVSASADEELRREVAAGMLPRPEYLVLETDHQVELLDWSQLPHRASRAGRSVGTSMTHVNAALSRAHEATAILSDGEHLGIPLGAALRATRREVPHVVIGHHLDTPKKRLLFRTLGAGRHMDRVLVHSPRQREVAIQELGIDADRVFVLPYAVDTEFWEAGAGAAPAWPTIASAGIEHRDYRTLAEATKGLDARLQVSMGSTHSPQSRGRLPDRWPEHAEVSFAQPAELRRRYMEATVVAVPVTETEFPAGITTLLEAMSMGKAVVVSATRGMSGIVEDGETGLLVPPGDVSALHRALDRLLQDQVLRRRLAVQARSFAVREAGVERFAAGLARHLREVAEPSSDAPARHLSTPLERHA